MCCGWSLCVESVEEECKQADAAIDFVEENTELYDEGCGSNERIWLRVLLRCSGATATTAPPNKSLATLAARRPAAGNGKRLFSNL